MKRIITLAAIFVQCLIGMAQEAPTQGWAKKALKSIISVNTYDQEQNLLHSGTGFYVTGNGIAVADYDLFRNAYSAVIIDQAGNKSNVVRILGANDTYGLVKFSTDVNKTTPLTLSKEKLAEGSKLMILPYSKSKPATCPAANVKSIETVNDSIPYYTLDYPIDAKYAGCPVFNTEGEVVATLQQPLTNKGYAIGIDFAKNLSIGAISTKVDNYALNNINIKKGLPETKEESLVYLYFKSNTADNDEYIDLLNLFIDTYPDNAEGYLRRATPLIDTYKFEEADKDLQHYYELAADKADANAKIAEIIQAKLTYQPDSAYAKWNYDVAVDYVNKAIEASPKYEYRALKAKILMAKQDFDGAYDIYDQMNKSEERSPATLYAASIASENRGDSTAVQIELLDSAIAMMPTPMPAEAATYIMRHALLLTRVGRYRDAVADYNKYSYLSNSSVNHKFYFDRALLEINSKMYQQALDDLTTATNQAPGEPLYLLELAALQLRVGMNKECIESAKKAMQLNPQSYDAYRILGYAQLVVGDKVNGKANLQRAIDMGDEAAKELLNNYNK